jgi:hypothetical protein
MSIISEASRRNCTHITQSEDADSQSAYLSQLAIRLRNSELLTKVFLTRADPSQIAGL